MIDERVPEGVPDDDVIKCDACRKVIGYWQDDETPISFTPFRMCPSGYTCRPCQEANHDCDD